MRNFLLVMCFCTIAFSSVNSTTITAVNSGDWNTASIWSTNSVPTASDDVIIPNGFTVTLDGTNNFCNTLTINSGGVMNCNSTSGGSKVLFVGQSSVSLTPQGGNKLVTVAGTLVLFTNNTMVVSGQVDIQNGGAFTMSGSSVLSISGDSGSSGTSVTDYLFRIDDGSTFSVNGGTINLYRPHSSTVASISGNKNFFTGSSDNNLVIFQGSVQGSTQAHRIGYDGTTPQLWNTQVNSTSAANIKNAKVFGLFYNFGGAVTIDNAKFYSLDNGTGGTISGSAVMQSTRGIGTIQGNGDYDFTALTIDNTSDVQIKKVLTLDCPITFVNGRLRLTTNKLTLGPNATWSGTSSTRYFQTSGAGRLVYTIGAGETKTMPMGNTSYNPITITMPNDERTMSFRVLEGQPANAGAGHVTRSWEVYIETGGSSVETNVTVQWDEAQEDATFSSNRNNCKMYYHDGTNWQELTPTAGPTSSSGTTHTKVLSGTMIIDNAPKNLNMLLPAALPVELAQFNATKRGNTAVLGWYTASEENNAGFIVEKSTDGRRFDRIGFVEAMGSGYSYEFIDNNFKRISYYRLKQMDRDGSYHYSRVVSLAPDNNVAWAAVTPSVVEDFMTIEIDDTNEVKGRIEVFDLSGRVVYQSNTLQEMNRVSVAHLAKGMYIVKVTRSTDEFIQKIVKR